MQNDCSVHTVETPDITHAVTSYRNTQKKHCRIELTAVEELYTHFDNLEGTQRQKALLECRTRAWFVRSREDGFVKVASNACRLRWCPLCSKARQNYIRHQVSDWFTEAYYPKFLTLTVLHTQQDLATQIDRIYHAFRELRRAKFFRDHCTGGIWFFQLCWNPKRQEWHPHLHTILSGQYMDYKRLKQLWYYYTQDSDILDIRPVKDPKKVADYVARYAARPLELSSLPNKQAIEAMSSLFGRRLAGCFGSAKSISLRPKKIPDPENWEYLGSWRIIHELSRYDDDAKQILNAYYNHLSIDEGLSCYEYEVFIDSEGTISNNDLHVDPPPQPLLF